MACFPRPDLASQRTANTSNALSLPGNTGANLMREHSKQVELALHILRAMPLLGARAGARADMAHKAGCLMAPRASTVQGANKLHATSQNFSTTTSGA
eukprot:CAMPEP_0170404916 /NCGR_PEP_ID=MMETSP0117_2-20130122/26895_1 /TAXON_ID=400756 /ORGANISM="Durinskia baltica, Strain CSIRO CS-38" /LENGTH=97 /DNA_ID=CAMNT_0010661981 /DNA_START=400 /DNA_END=693 /DNA_ORIENTATION=-